MVPGPRVEGREEGVAAARGVGAKACGRERRGRDGEGSDVSEECDQSAFTYEVVWPLNDIHGTENLATLIKDP